MSQPDTAQDPIGCAPQTEQGKISGQDVAAYPVANVPRTPRLCGFVR